MAGEWLKIEKATPEKPELRTAARLCGVGRAEAFLAFFCLWRYFDSHCEDGYIAGLTKVDVDDIAGVKGFALAMENIGWLAFDGDAGLTIRNWARHNGKSAKARAQTMNRVQAHRAEKHWDPKR